MTPGTLTLADFLLARIAEDEASAKAALAEAEWEASEPFLNAWVAFSARHDPARVLAECEAKRRIVEDHGWEYADPYESWKGPEYRAKWGDTRHLKNCKRCGGVSHHPNLGEVERRDSWPCATLKALTLPYADHPDYREEWRP